MTAWEPQRAVKVGRTISNMTQVELAERLTAVTGEPWTRAMVAALEGGRKAFTVETLIDIARIQGMPYSFYLEGIAVDNPGYDDLTSDNPLFALRNSNQVNRWVDLTVDDFYTEPASA